LGQKWTQIPHPLHQSRWITCVFNFNFVIRIPVRSRFPHGASSRTVAVIPETT
jgi:hypothetical protein